MACGFDGPGMREHRGGRILNVSSMGGRTTLPGGAFYHASKYAVIRRQSGLPG
ncbi:MAG: SDR family NAD(P)-dependent oxidoreductase [Streptosporangiales bacterium]